MQKNERSKITKTKEKPHQSHQGLPPKNEGEKGKRFVRVFTVVPRITRGQDRPRHTVAFLAGALTKSKGSESQLIHVMVMDNYYCTCYCWLSEAKGKEKGCY